jgi:excisionase family DNA binding protein
VSAGTTLEEQGKIAYSIPEFCSACAVGRTFVYEEIKAGRLGAIKAGRRTLIDAAEARRWLCALQQITASDPRTRVHGHGAGPCSPSPSFSRPPHRP